MRRSEVMAALKAEGSDQTRRIYSRHGAQEPMFGVSYAALGRLEKQLRGAHDLGLELWATGNHDARMLAAKIVDPQRFTVKLADAWVGDAVCYQTAGAVADVVAASPVARSRSDAWRDRRGEWVASAGWGIVARTCEDAELWSGQELRGLLRQIEGEIHDRPNRVRHEMNMVLICIALRDGNLRRQARATASRIGPVVVDHGQTSCTTPEATAYIDRAVAHRARRAVRSG